MAAHFTEAAPKFLRALAKHNDRDWFNARKETYERELRQPLLELIEEVNGGFARFAPDHVRPVQKAAMRIYRDIRFSKDKQPYKTNLAAWWARTGLEKTSGGGFYFELNPEGLTLAAGCYMPQREQLLAIRRMLVARHQDYRRLLAARPLKTAGMVAFDGLRMTRVPKGFAADDPAEELIRQRQWGVSTRLDLAPAYAPTLAKTILAAFKAAAPLVHLLNEPLVTTVSKPLF